MKYRLTLVGAGVLCASIATQAMAQDEVLLDRYVTIKTTASAEQKNVLVQVIDVQIPESIETVGDAMAYVLKPTGYALADKHDSLVTQMLGKPLPDNHRDLSNLRLSESLYLLAGGAFDAMIDPVHRLVSFQINPMYAQLFMDDEGNLL